MSPLAMLSLLWTGAQAVELLGAGEGPGSCAAPPFRGQEMLTVKWRTLSVSKIFNAGKRLNWPNGCPLTVPCCNEYGYCKTEAEWLSGM